MQVFSIPIMAIRLIDLDLPNKPFAHINFIGAAKDLIRNHQEQAIAAGVDLELFHNKKIAYSAIQLDRYQGSPEWTGYGEEAVEALWFWLALYQKENPQKLLNSVIIQEHYSPAFLPQARTYRMDCFLLSDAVANSLFAIRNKREQTERLEKYLYGNIRRFLKFMAYTYDKEEHFLEIKILHFQRLDRPFPVHHRYKKTALAITFACNFRLPQTLRLGQSTALGYGKITHL